MSSRRGARAPATANDVSLARAQLSRCADVAREWDRQARIAVAVLPFGVEPDEVAIPKARQKALIAMQSKFEDEEGNVRDLGYKLTEEQIYNKIIQIAEDLLNGFAGAEKRARKEGFYLGYGSDPTPLHVYAERSGMSTLANALEQITRVGPRRLG